MTGFSVGSKTWYYPQNTHPYSDYDATYATSDKTNFFGDDFSGRSDSTIEMKNNAALPANDTAYFRFNHAFGFDTNSAGSIAYDGGVVEYSTDSGVTWNDVGALPTDQGYNSTLYTDPNASRRNPLAGRRAFGVVSGGYIATRYNLDALKGQNVRFRFRTGTDYIGGYQGWFIDDISLYTCFNTAGLAFKIFLPFVVR